jgi:hypothetical protein
VSDILVRGRIKTDFFVGTSASEEKITDIGRSEIFVKKNCETIKEQNTQFLLILGTKLNFKDSEKKMSELL